MKKVCVFFVVMFLVGVVIQFGRIDFSPRKSEGEAYRPAATFPDEDAAMVAAAPNINNEGKRET